MGKYRFWALCVVALVVLAVPAGATHRSSGPGPVVFRVDTERHVDLRAMAVDSMGRTILLISRGSGPIRTAEVVRHGADGQLDTSFGNGGRVVLRLSADRDVALDGSGLSPGDVVVDDLGRLVIVGSGGARSSQPLALRLLESGEPDPTFGDHGIVIFEDVGFGALSAVALDRGAVIAAGWWSSDFTALRILDDGSIDAEFGDGGVAHVSVGLTPRSTDMAKFIEVFPDGSLVLAGDYADDGATGAEGAVVKLDPSGLLDHNFGDDGIFRVGTGDVVSENITDLAIMRDGRIVITTSRFDDGVFDVRAYRLLGDGTLDPTFGEGGVAVSEEASSARVEVLPDGELLFDGAELERLHLDGGRDASFGVNGTFHTRLSEMVVDSNSMLTIASFGNLERRAMPKASTGAGFWLIGRNGSVYDFGEAPATESLAKSSEPRSIVAGAASADGHSIWLLDESGELFASGSANDFGGVPQPLLVADEVWADLIAPPDGSGVWLVTNRGRVVALGDVADLGDTSGMALDADIVAAAASPDGGGYYLLGADGGVFAFGTARFSGSIPSLLGTQFAALDWLDARAVGVVPTATGNGYWIAASDGAVFAFGDAEFHGSIPGVIGRHSSLRAPIFDIIGGLDGYYLTGSDGGVFAFGRAPFVGSLGWAATSAPIGAVVSMRSVPPPPPPLPPRILQVGGVALCNELPAIPRQDGTTFTSLRIAVEAFRPILARADIAADVSIDFDAGAVRVELTVVEEDSVAELLDAINSELICVAGPLRSADSLDRGELTVGVGAESVGLRPWRDPCTASCPMLATSIYDKLFELDDKHQATPFLAAGITANTDLTVWIMTLREDVVFHNGERLTAQTIEDMFSLQRMGSFGGDLVIKAGLESVTASGPFEVTYTLSEPNSAFAVNLSTWALGTVFEPDRAEADPDGYISNPVGTGPFRVLHRSGDGTLVARNQHYWMTDAVGNQLPYLNAISFLRIRDDDVRLDALVSGSIDVMQTSNSATIGSAREEADIALFEQRNDNFTGGIFNVLIAPFDDVRVRRGLVQLIDQDAVVAAEGGGISVPATQWFSPDSPWYSEAVAAAWPEFDVVAGSTLLQQYVNDPGRSDSRDVGDRIEVVLSCPPDPNLIASMQVIEAAWSATGLVNVTLTNFDWSTHITNALGLKNGFVGNHGAHCWRWFTDDDPAIWLPEAFAAPTTDIALANNVPLGPANWSNYFNAEVYDWIVEASKTADFEQRRALYEQVMLKLTEDVPGWYAGHTFTLVAANPDVVGFSDSTTPDGVRVASRGEFVARWHQARIVD